MNITVTAVSNEVFNDNYIEDLERFSGKCAGVCYMKDAYFGTNVSDNEKALSRFNRVIQTGHDSISDHTVISVLFENIPKMTAMILNSLGFYNTSEKSGRYTVMSSKEQANTDNERLYYKWYDIFKTLIKKYDPNLCETNSSLHDKLALENARYMLSVFAPNTTMMYTTSLRMWSYILCWCKNYIDIADMSTDFNKYVNKCIEDLYLNLLHTKCFSKKIIDTKGRKFNFLAKQVGYPISSANERYDDSYLIKYKASMADLAQEQRHRTLDYFMVFDGSSKIDFYVPDILKLSENREFEKEWLSDLNTIKDTFPIATLVDVVETGLISNFMLKCDERLCGRTMLETMNTVKINLLKFVRNWNKSPFTSHELERHFRDGKIIMKCGNVQCKEPCYWGPIKSQDKKI